MRPFETSNRTQTMAQIRFRPMSSLTKKVSGGFRGKAAALTQVQLQHKSAGLRSRASICDAENCSDRSK